jgi:hypothetical protein
MGRSRRDGLNPGLSPDDHALEIVRNIVANLNTVKKVDIALREPRPPAYDPAELDGVVPASLMTQYDTREIIARIVDGSEMNEFKANNAQTLVTDDHRDLRHLRARHRRHHLGAVAGDAAVRPGVLAELPLHVAEYAHLRDGQPAGGRRAGDRAPRQHRGRGQVTCSPRRPHG